MKALSKRSVLAALALMTTTLGAQIAPERPQTPEPPFPYTSEDVTIDATDDCLDGDRWVVAAETYTHTLGATITIPDKSTHGDGPFPGVVLVSGSGAQNRNCDIMAHSFFLVLADHLTRQGIAVIRYDDRGFGESTGSFVDTPIQGHARDAFFAAHTLMAHPDVDPERVGIVGHSQGGTVAPFAAHRDPNIAFLVLLAGSGVQGADVLIDQTEIVYSKTRFDQEYIDAAIEKRRALFAAACGGADDDELLELVTDIAQTEFRAPERENARQLAQGLTPQFVSPPIRSFMCFDPGEYLAQTTIPVLAMNGSLDSQVTPRLNLDAIRDALAAAGNANATTIELSGLNHLFQPARTGEVGEYGTIPITISPRALTLISAWILETTSVE